MTEYPDWDALIRAHPELADDDDNEVLVFEGKGLLSGAWPSRAEYNREREEARKREAEEATREAEAAAAAAEVQHTCDIIDKFIIEPHFADDVNFLVEEKIFASPEQRKDFAKFQNYCPKWGLSSLPAFPHAIAAFLIEESEHGAEHVEHLVASISVLHRMVGFPDPTVDVRVRGVLRRIFREAAEKEKGN